MADSSWMARVGARLVANGYAILPIADRGTGPRTTHTRFQPNPDEV